MTALDALQAARKAGVLREVDYYFAQHLLGLVDCNTPSVALAVAALSRALGEGDTCLALPRFAGQSLFARELPPGETGQAFAGVTAPGLAEWRGALEGSGLVATPAAPAGHPMVLDAAHRLYFARHFNQEQRVAGALAARTQTKPYAGASPAAIEAALDRAFPPTAHDPDQRAAARLALTQPFALITGGPGTGKTTTVARLLALMAALGGPDAPPAVLAAPTGKAANRLMESIAAARDRLRADGTPPEDLARIPAEARTLHRLLGLRPGSQQARYHAGNPLPPGVLVVDEASMVDLTMMSRVLSALPADGRLVLLGDADQLASVEAGAVLGDLCEAARMWGGKGFVAALTRSHRFRANGGIGRLASAIRAGDAPATHAALVDDPDARLEQGGLSALAARAVVAWRSCFEATSPTGALGGLGRFRVLCALRDGAEGVVGVTTLLEQALAAAGLISPGERYYRGRPVLVTANDYTVELFNGDVGIVWPDDDGVLRAWFPGAAGAPRAVPTNRLPAHETAFAMTVHKAQGSEFDEVALVLPSRESPVLSRELLYTAVTRARRAVVILAGSRSLDWCLARPVSRTSGLRDAVLRDLDAAPT